MSHVSHINHSYIYKYVFIISQRESARFAVMNEWIIHMSHIWMNHSYVTHMNFSAAHKGFTSHIAAATHRDRDSRVHMNVSRWFICETWLVHESYHTYEWVMSHIWIVHRYSCRESSHHTLTLTLTLTHTHTREACLLVCVCVCVWVCHVCLCVRHDTVSVSGSCLTPSLWVCQTHSLWAMRHVSVSAMSVSGSCLRHETCLTSRECDSHIHSFTNESCSFIRDSCVWMNEFECIALIHTRFVTNASRSFIRHSWRMNRTHSWTIRDECIALIHTPFVTNESHSFMNDSWRMNRAHSYAIRDEWIALIHERFVTNASRSFIRDSWRMNRADWARIIRHERTRVYAIAYECMHRVSRMNEWIHTQYAIHAFIRDCIHTCMNERDSFVTNRSSESQVIHMTTHAMLGCCHELYHVIPTNSICIYKQSRNTHTVALTPLHSWIQ